MEELFPRSEPLGSSTIDFLNLSLELLPILLLVRSDSHHISALHDFLSIGQGSIIAVKKPWSSREIPARAV
jgi:hypothetical protein